MLVERPVLRVKKYGPVDLLVESGCHRYESRMTSDRVWLLIGAITGGTLTAAILSQGLSSLSDMPKPLVIGILGVIAAIALTSLWAFNVAVRQRASLVFAPHAITFELAGLFPLGRSGKWIWPPDQLQSIAVNTLPFYDRGGQFLRAGIELMFANRDQPLKTYFIFYSPAAAEALKRDMLSSWTEMMALAGKGPDTRDGLR